jgi:ribonuclease E
MHDGPGPGSSDDSDGSRRGRRGGRRGSRGPREREEAPPPAETDDAPEGENGERRSPLPRHQLLHPTPIPGRLRTDAEEGLDSILSEIESDAPTTEVAPPAPRREREERRGGRERGERGDRGGRAGRAPRDAGAPTSGPAPLASAAPPRATSSTPSTYSDEEFGVGVFEEPRPAPVRRQAPPVREPEVAAPLPAPVPKREREEGDDFGAGIV